MTTKETEKNTKAASTIALDACCEVDQIELAIAQLQTSKSADLLSTAETLEIKICALTETLLLERSKRGSGFLDASLYILGSQLMRVLNIIRESKL